MFNKKQSLILIISIISTLFIFSCDNTNVADDNTADALIAYNEITKKSLSAFQMDVPDWWEFLNGQEIEGALECVTFSTKSSIDMEDLLSNDFWTLEINMAMNECTQDNINSVSSDLTAIIYGTRIGIVTKVHVFGTFQIAGEVNGLYNIAIEYDLSDCFSSWDCVDWSGTINGIDINDLI